MAAATFPSRLARFRRLGERNGIGWSWQLAVLLLGFVLVVSRRPDALFNAQFFGEDGSIWFPHAYAAGWFQALLHSQDGYFQTLPRLAAALALQVPFRFAPLLLNVIAIVLQVLPANFLLSERCRNWGPLWMRSAMAILYIALPNTSEVDASMEEGQWHLALLAVLVVLSTIPRGFAWRAFDSAVILLSGLSGPFCIALFPLAAIYWWFRRERWRLVLCALLAICCAVQGAALLSLGSTVRESVGLGATPKLFVKILGGHVYLAALLGQSAFAGEPAITIAEVALFATILVAYSVWRAPIEWKLFLCFCMLIFAASLSAPQASNTIPQWQILNMTPGVRYWFFPTLAFAWTLIWCASPRRTAVIRVSAIGALVLMCVGVTRDWRYPAFTDFHFSDYARQFDAAPPGQLIEIPINPPDWKMKLLKKAPKETTGNGGVQAVR